MEPINYVVARNDLDAKVMAGYPPPIGGGFVSLLEALEALRNVRSLEDNLPRPERVKGDYAIYVVTVLVKRLVL